MKRIPDVELVLRAYFADDGGSAPDYVIDEVGRRIGRQRQRRSWPFPGRTTTVSTQLKLIAGLAAALVVAVIGYSLLPGGAGPGAPSAAPTTAPTVAPTAVVTPVPTASVPDLPDGTLAAGRYRIRPLPDDPDLGNLTLVADIPEGWQGHRDVPALTSPRTDNDNGVLIGFMKADTLFSDPCHWDLDGSGDRGQPGDIVVEPDRLSLAGALSTNPAYTYNGSEPYSLDGFPAIDVKLQLPGEDVLATCDVSPDSGGTEGDFIVFGGGFWAQGHDNHWQLNAIEVDGSMLVVLISYFAPTSSIQVEAGQGIVESFDITP